MNQFPAGKRVVGRLNAQAFVANTPVAITFKDMDGTAHPFAAGERLVIYYVRQAPVAGGTAVIRIMQDYDAGADFDGGEQLITLSSDTTIPGLPDDATIPGGIPSQRINTAASNTFYAVSNAALTSDVLVVADVLKV